MADAISDAIPSVRCAELTVSGVRTRLIEVPLRFVLGTSADAVARAPILLADLETNEGPTGRAYVFAYRRSGGAAISAILEDAVDVVKGQPADPVGVAATLGRAFALLGVTGVARMALSVLDMALWDALAKAAGLPLATICGGRPGRIRAYNSCGLGMMSPEAAADEAEELLDGGFAAVKLRLGYPTLAEDVAVLRAVRNRLPDPVAIMVDFNQALTMTDALERGRAIESEGIYWIEEPIRHDDWRGNSTLAKALSVPIQLGENFNGVEAMAAAVSAGACDLVMPDTARIGGVTGWLHAAGIASAHGIPMSSHLMPEVSGHLLCATPTAHWLEYVDWMNDFLLDPPRLIDGHLEVPSHPGIGVEWDEDRVRQLLI